MMETGPLILADDQVVENLAGEKHLDSTIQHLYRAYFRYVGSFVVNNGGDWQDAEDIFQEILVAFIQLVRRGKFRGESSIKTFLFALNRNLWLNELKRRGRARTREDRFEQGREETESLGAVLESREATAGLMRTMEALGEACKKILLLYYFENRSMKEILAALPYENEQVVRNKKHKCLKKLQQMLHENEALYKQLKSFLYG